MGKNIYRNNQNLIYQENSKYKNTNLIITLLFIASIPHAIYILFAAYPQFLKILSSGLLWISLLLSIENMIIYKKSHHRIIGKLIFFLLLISVLQFFRFFLYGGYTNFLTTMTNPYYGLCILTPIIFYSLQSFSILKRIFKFSIYLIVISILFAKSNYYLLYMAPILVYYIYNKNFKVLLITLFSIFFIIKDAIIPNTDTEDTQRALLIILAYSSLVIVAFLFKKYARLITSIIAIISIVTPILLFSFSIYTKTSVFQYVNEIDNEQLNKDTRTFLYEELLTDLNKQDSFIQGFGISNGYYSPFFSESVNNRRDVNEVTFLHLLMRGGLIWLLLYMIIIIYSIFYSIKNSNNNLCLGASIMLSGYFFSSFIIDSNSVNFIHIIIWFLIVICNSPIYNNLSNIEISKILNSK